MKILIILIRLLQVDGDTDNVSVQREFERVIRQHTSRLGHTATYKVQAPSQQPTNNSSSSNQRSANTARLQHDTIDLEDLDNVPGTVPTISNHISLIQNNKGTNEPEINNVNNNYGNNVNKTTSMTNNTSSKHTNNNNHTDANGMLLSGATTVANGPKTFRSMLEEAETYPIDL